MLKNIKWATGLAKIQLLGAHTKPTRLALIKYAVSRTIIWLKYPLKYVPLPHDLKPI
jgi:hypothetical protein